MEPEVKAFVEAIGAMEPDQNSTLYAAYRQFFRRRSYFLFKGQFLIVKISRSEKPFWGLGKKYVDLLNGTENYFLVLLTSARDGYVFTKNEINQFIEKGRWRLGTGDQYKINYPLPDRSSFRSPENFLIKTDL